jgi:hypothetical protein
MFDQMTYSLPFTAEVGELGLQEAHGILQFSPKTGLTIEFQVKDSILGIIKSDVKSLRLNWSDIAYFEVKKKFFGAHVLIRVNKLTLFEELPASKAGEFKAKIKKSDLELARNLQSSLLLYLSEKKIEYLDSAHD